MPRGTHHCGIWSQLSDFKAESSLCRSSLPFSDPSTVWFLCLQVSNVSVLSHPWEILGLGFTWWNTRGHWSLCPFLDPSLHFVLRAPHSVYPLPLWSLLSHISRLLLSWSMTVHFGGSRVPFFAPFHPIHCARSSFTNYILRTAKSWFWLLDRRSIICLISPNGHFSKISHYFVQVSNPFSLSSPSQGPPILSRCPR